MSRARARCTHMAWRSVADVAAHRRRTELQAVPLAAELAELDRAARAAVAAGFDEQARHILARRIDAARRLDTLRAQHDALAAQEQALNDSLYRLEAQLEDARDQYRTLGAEQGAARAELNLRESLHGSAADGAADHAARQAALQARRMRAKAAGRSWQQRIPGRTRCGRHPMPWWQGPGPSGN
ncbi:PspA/IM30 family protein [Pseudarthrobacter sp. S9]|uniref:PspA/IM30 family protein n=1 Tax=Pseudarthrobacter sp. S9 TaxID=3418421 RepID=UPI003D063EBA